MMMEELAIFLLHNFTLTLFVIGLICSGLTLARAPKPLTGPVIAEALFKWFLFFSIGIAYIYNAFTHIVFHEMAAGFIGWADSPFQIELGFANLGLGLIGVIATWRSLEMRLAAILGLAPFSLGRRRNPHPFDDHRAQFRAGQCRHHLLERHPHTADRLHLPLASAPVRDRRPLRCALLLAPSLTP